VCGQGCGLGTADSGLAYGLRCGLGFVLVTGTVQWAGLWWTECRDGGWCFGARVAWVVLGSRLGWAGLRAGVWIGTRCRAGM
jgi:hypothetical protein